MSKKIVLDLSHLSEEEALKYTNEYIAAAINKTANTLAILTEAKVRELATDELKSSRSKYLEALSLDELTPGVWSVSLDSKVDWIEDGTPARSGYDFLLNGPKTKVSKDGSRYNIIPFNHSKRPTDMTPSAKKIVSILKKELVRKNIPFKGIEHEQHVSYDKEGGLIGISMTPKLGKIHSFDVPSPKTGKGVSPVLQGVNIYQRKTQDGKIQKDIMTFRVISSKTQGDGRWQYAEKEGKNFMDRAYNDVIAHIDELFTNILMENLEIK